MKMCSNQSLCISPSPQLSTMYVDIIETAFKATNKLPFEYFQVCYIGISNMIKWFDSSFVCKKRQEICLYCFMNLCFSVYQENLHSRNFLKSDDLRALGCFRISSVLMCSVPREIMLQDLPDQSVSWMTGRNFVCAQVGREWQIDIGPLHW